MGSLGIRVHVDYPTASEIEDHFDGLKAKLKILADDDSISKLKADLKELKNETIKINLDTNFGESLKEIQSVKRAYSELKGLTEKGVHVKMDVDGTSGIDKAQSKLRNTSVGKIDMSDVVRQSQHTMGEVQSLADKAGASISKVTQQTVLGIDGQLRASETVVKRLNRFKTETSKLVDGKKLSITTDSNQEAALRSIVSLRKEIGNLETKSVNASKEQANAYNKQISNLRKELNGSLKDYKETFGKFATDSSQFSQADSAAKYSAELARINAQKQKQVALEKQTAQAVSTVMRLENQRSNIQKKINSGSGDSETSVLLAQKRAIEGKAAAVARVANLEKNASSAQKASLADQRAENRLSEALVSAKQADAAAAREERTAYAQLKSELQQVVKMENEIARLESKGEAAGGLGPKDSDRLASLRQELSVRKELTSALNEQSSRESKLGTESRQALTAIKQQATAQREAAQALGEQEGKVQRANSLYKEWEDSVRRVAQLQRQAASAGTNESAVINKAVAAEDRKQAAIKDSLQAQNSLNRAHVEEIAKIEAAGRAEAKHASDIRSARETDSGISARRAKTGGILPTFDLVQFGQDAAQGVGYIVNSVNEVDKAITGVTKVVSANKKDLADFRTSIYDTASSVGKSATEYANSVERWASAGKGFKESQSLAKISTMGAFVGNINEEDMVQYMAVPLNAWKKSGLQATDVINAMNEVANKNAVEMDDLGKAYQRAATTAKNSGTSFAQMTGMITGAQEATRAGGEKIGTALRAVDVNYGKIAQDLTPADQTKHDFFENLGVHLKDSNGKLQSTYNINKQLAGQWDKMSANQKSIAAFYAAGKQHSAVFSGMMDNWATVEKATQQAQNQVDLFDKNSGSAFQEFAKQKHTVAFELNNVKNQFDKLISTVVGGKEGISKMLHGVGEALQFVNEKASDKGFMDFLKSMAKGAAVFAFADVASKGLKKLHTSVTGTFGELKKGFESIKGIGKSDINTSLGADKAETSLTRLNSTISRTIEQYDRMAAAAARAGRAASIPIHNPSTTGPLAGKNVTLNTTSAGTRRAKQEVEEVGEAAQKSRTLVQDLDSAGGMTTLSSGARRAKTETENVGKAAESGKRHVKDLDDSGQFRKYSIGTKEAKKGTDELGNSAKKSSKVVKESSKEASDGVAKIGAKSAESGAKAASGIGKIVGGFGKLFQAVMHFIPILDVLAVGLDIADLAGFDVWGKLGGMIKKVTDNTTEADKALKNYTNSQKALRKNLFESGLTDGTMAETKSLQKRNDTLLKTAQSDAKTLNASLGTSIKGYFTPDQFASVAKNAKTELSELNKQAKRLGVDPVHMKFDINDYDTVKSQLEELKRLKSEVDTAEVNKYASSVRGLNKGSESSEDILKNSSKSDLDTIRAQLKAAENGVTQQDKQDEVKYRKMLNDRKQYWQSAQAVDDLFASKQYKTLVKTWDSNVKALHQSQNQLMNNLDSLDTSQISGKNKKVVAGELLMGGTEAKRSGDAVNGIMDKINSKQKISKSQLSQIKQAYKALGKDAPEYLSTETASWGKESEAIKSNLAEYKQMQEQKRTIAKGKFDEIVKDAGLSSKKADDAWNNGGTGLIKFIGQLGKAGQTMLGMSKYTSDALGKGWVSKLTSMQKAVDKIPEKKQINFKLKDDITGTVNQKVMTAIYKVPKQLTTAWGIRKANGALDMNAVQGLINGVPKDVLTHWGIVKANGELDPAGIEVMMKAIPKDVATRWGLVKDGEFQSGAFQQMLTEVDKIPKDKTTRWLFTKEGDVKMDAIAAVGKIPKSVYTQLHVQTNDPGGLLQKLANPHGKKEKAIVQEVMTKYIDGKDDPTKKTKTQPVTLKISASGVKDAKKASDALKDIKDKDAAVKVDVSGKKDATSVAKSVDKIKDKTAKVKVEVSGKKDATAMAKEVKKIKGKSPKVKVTVSGKNDMKTLISNLKKLKGKTVKIKVSVSGKNNITSVTSNLKKLKAKNVKIKVATTGTKSISTLTSDLKKLSTKSVKIKVSTSGTKDINSISKSIKSIKNANVKIKVTTSGTKNISSIAKSIKSIKSANVKVKASVSGLSEVKTASKQISSLNGKNAKVKVTASYTGAGRVSQAKRDIARLKNKTVTVKITASGDVSGKVAAAKAAVTSLNGVVGKGKLTADSSNLDSKVAAAKAKITSLNSVSSTSKIKGNNSDLAAKVASAKQKIKSVPKSHNTDFRATMSGAWGTVEKYMNMSSHTIHVNANVSVTKTVHTKKGDSVSIDADDVVGNGIAGVISNSVSVGDNLAASNPVASDLPKGTSYTSRSESDDSDKNYKASQDIWRYWGKEEYEGKDIETQISKLEDAVTNAGENINKIISLHKQQLSALDKQYNYEKSLNSSKQSEMNSLLSQLGKYGFKHKGNEITNLGHITSLSGPNQKKAEETLNQWKTVYEDMGSISDKMREIRQSQADIKKDIQDKKDEQADTALDKKISHEGLWTDMLSNQLTLIESRLNLIGEKDFILRYNTLGDGVNVATKNIELLVNQYNKLAAASYRNSDAAEKAEGQLDSIKTAILENADSIITYRQQMNDIPITRLTEDMTAFDDAMKRQSDSLQNNIDILKEGLVSGTSLNDLESSMLNSFNFDGRDQWQKEHDERVKLEEDLNNKLDEFNREKILQENKVANAKLKINQNMYKDLLSMAQDFNNGKLTKTYQMLDVYGVWGQKKATSVYGAETTGVDRNFEKQLTDISNKYKVMMEEQLAKYNASRTGSVEDIKEADLEMTLTQMDMQRKQYEDVIVAYKDAIARATALIGNADLTQEQHETLQSSINEYEDAITEAQKNIQEVAKSRYDYEMEQLDKLMEKYSKATERMDNLKSIAETLGLSSSEKAGVFEGYFQAKAQEMAANEQLLTSLMDKQSKVDVNSYEYQQLETKMKEVSDNVNTLTGDLLTANKDRLSNQLDTIKETIQRNLLNGMSSDEWSNNKNLWISGLEKELTIEDMKTKADELEASNIKERLNVLDRQEKLSKIESDYLSKQLDVIDLQNKANALMNDRTVKTISKNTNGEWDWSYDVDQTQIDENTANLHKAQEELEQQKDQAREDYVTKLSSIIEKAQGGGLSHDQLVSQIQDLTNSYQPILNDIPNMDFGNIDSIVDAYDNYVDANKDILDHHASNTADGQTSEFQQIVQGFGNQFKQVSKDLGAIFGQEFKNIISGVDLNTLQANGATSSASYVIQNQTLEFPNVTSSDGLEDAIKQLPAAMAQYTLGK